VKKILILGENSYIGNAFETYAKKFPEKYTVTTLSLRGEDWQNYDMSDYDVAFNVTGIAHADVEKVTEEQKKLYYQVNTELAINVAEKYKSDRNGKKSQYIYMSSIIVYGDNYSVRHKKIITDKTVPEPANFYGDSKLQAEKGLSYLRNDNFLVVILRPPMIYGGNSRGNYRLLQKIAHISPIFPNFINQRSVLSIENLCTFIGSKIDYNDNGLYFPQDKHYACTSDMVKSIANEENGKIYLIKGFNWLIYLASFLPGKMGKMVNKAFGTLVYQVK